MAKFQGFIGSGRGKAGNLVFAKGPNGSTIARAYQPQVANPKTTLQIQQRAKVNAAGRFSRIFSKSAISTIGMNGLANRSFFNKNLIDNAKYYSASRKASVVPELVKFSRGGQAFATILTDAVNITMSQDLTRVTVHFANFEPSTQDRIVRVFLAFIPHEAEDIAAFGQFHTALITPSTEEINVSFYSAFEAQYDNTERGRYFAWAVVSTPEATLTQKYHTLLSGGTLGAYEIEAAVSEIASATNDWSDTFYCGDYQNTTVNP